MRNPILSSFSSGNFAPTRQGGATFVPKPMKASITLPNFSSAMRMLLMRNAEQPETYGSLKSAGGSRLARLDFGGVRSRG